MDSVLIGEILEPGDDRTRQERENTVRDRFWRTARRAARQVPFMEDVAAGYYCAMDRETPMRVRGILLAALAYFVVPIDVVPDIFAFVGFSDDVAVLTAALAAISAHIRPAHYDAARKALTEDAY